MRFYALCWTRMRALSRRFANMKKDAVGSLRYYYTEYWRIDMCKDKTGERESVLSAVKPSKAIVSLAVPATLALLEKAIYNMWIRRISACCTAMKRWRRWA